MYRLYRAPEPPASVESQALVIERLTALGQLQLLEYQVRDVVSREWHYSVPFASSRILMVVAGHATVCMDFSKVQVEEADWSDHRIQLRLPPPYLCSVRVDPKASQVYDASFSIVEWWQDGEAERVREALAAAQETLRVRLSQHFSRSAAQAQAEKLLRTLLVEMGWKDIAFTYASGS